MSLSRVQVDDPEDAYMASGTSAFLRISLVLTKKLGGSSKDMAEREEADMAVSRRVESAGTFSLVLPKDESPTEDAEVAGLSIFIAATVSVQK